uniref:NAC domain-containing protein n=1 Tax=Leersia perrieri TaxID=77586 RepID=A0A0D9XJD1_9ORYZ
MSSYVPDGSIIISNEKKNKVEPEYGKNRHGLEIGTYFVPKDLELLAILKCKLVRGQLTAPLSNVFSDINILQFHPARAFATNTGNKKRPIRVARGGTWKASGGSKTVRSKKVGGVDVGHKLTMVFYEKLHDGADRAPPRKTNWGMHEFTKIIPASKNKLEELALYRLYKIKREDHDNGEQNEEPSTSSPMDHLSSAIVLAGSSLSMAMAQLQQPPMSILAMAGAGGGMMMMSQLSAASTVANGGAAAAAAAFSLSPMQQQQQLGGGFLTMMEADIDPMEPVLEVEPIAVIPPPPEPMMMPALLPATNGTEQKQSSPAPAPAPSAMEEEVGDSHDNQQQQQQGRQTADGADCCGAMAIDGDEQQCSPMASAASAAADIELDDSLEIDFNLLFDDGTQISIS